ncbi:dUTP diphosphatase [Mediterraneibacter glycyrrhizinilyticus]|uniref:dUTP diphosphatase n=1 Tax=Mediterraneibacter glycyrrhizinilyticus TaxID=342942 RepID=UPI0009F8F584
MPYDCTLKPGEIARIPLGFGLMIPDGYAGYVFPRSSMAAKGLVCEFPPIDSGYRGEIHAIISNISSECQTLHKNTRVGQLVITPVLIADFVLDLGEERNTRAFGSTGE